MFIDLISEFESEITGEKFIDLLSNVFEVNQRQRQYSGPVICYMSDKALGLTRSHDIA